MAFIKKFNSKVIFLQFTNAFLLVCSICPPSLILKEMPLTNNFGQYPVSGIPWMSIIILCNAASGTVISPTQWLARNALDNEKLQCTVLRELMRCFVLQHQYMFHLHLSYTEVDF